MWHAGINKALFCLRSVIQCRLLKVSIFCLGAGDQRCSDYCLFLLCILAGNTILSAALVSGVYFPLQLLKTIWNLWNIFCTWKNMSILKRIYVQYIYLYFYQSLYSYRHSLCCTFFHCHSYVRLACAPCKNFNLHLAMCRRCVCQCVWDFVPGCMSLDRRWVVLDFPKLHTFETTLIRTGLFIFCLTSTFAARALRGHGGLDGLNRFFLDNIGKLNFVFNEALLCKNLKDLRRCGPPGLLCASSFRTVSCRALLLVLRLCHWLQRSPLLPSETGIDEHACGRRHVRSLYLHPHGPNPHCPGGQDSQRWNQIYGPKASSLTHIRYDGNFKRMITFIFMLF